MFDQNDHNFLSFDAVDSGAALLAQKGSKNHIHSQAFMTQIPFKMMIIVWALRSFAKQK